MGSIREGAKPVAQIGNLSRMRERLPARATMVLSATPSSLTLPEVFLIIVTRRSIKDGRRYTLSWGRGQG